MANLFYQYRFWWASVRYQDEQSTYNTEERGVSVVIAARNEARNLEKHLPAFLEQDYPNYEVVLVNDCSFDESADLLSGFAVRYPHLKVVTIEDQPKYPTGKKFALTLGIKAATHDVLLFSDADCRPASNQWVRIMQQCYVDKTEIVLGYGAYEKRAGFLNAMVRYDTVLTAMQYFSHALSRRAFMGVGRNLSYLKALFFFHKGFVSHIKHPSGDDSLFVNASANRDNVRVCMAPEAATISVPSDSLVALNRQKSRHLSNSRFYKAADKFWTGYFGLSSWLMLLSLFVAIYWYGDQLHFLLASIVVFLFTWLHKHVFLLVFAKKMHETGLAAWLPLVAPMYHSLQLYWALKGYLGKAKW